MKTKLMYFALMLCLMQAGRAQAQTETTEAAAELGELSSVRLSWSKSDVLEKTLSKLFPEVVFSSNPEFNVLYFRSDSDEAEKIRTFLAREEDYAQSLRESIEPTKPNVASAGMTEIVVVQHSPASSVVEFVKQMYPDQNLRIASEGQQVFLQSADEDALARTRKLIEVLEKSNAGKGDDTRVNATPLSSREFIKSLIGDGDSKLKATPSNLNDAGAFRPNTPVDANRPSAPKSRIPTKAKSGIELFRAQQDFLKQQIALQRKKLELLERKLIEREKLAKEHFENQASKVSGNPSANIEYLPETNIVILRGEKDAVEDLSGVIQQIGAQANQPAPGKAAPISGEEPQQFKDNLPTDSDLQGSLSLPPPKNNLNVEKDGDQIELPEPVSSEQVVARMIRKYGGWYKLNERNRIEEVNMVYHEDENGKRYDNPQLNTDQSIKYISRLRDLKRLYLQSQQITDDSIQMLGNCRKLETFFVWDALSLSIAGIRELESLKALKSIHISDAGLTDESLEVFSKLPNIERLSLQGNRFTDKGLKFLSSRNSLRVVWVGLGENRFTDAGILQMQRLDNLETFGFQKSPVSKTTVAAFEKAGVELINPLVQN